MVKKQEKSQKENTRRTQCRLILNGAHVGFAKQWKFPKCLPAAKPPAQPPRSHLTCFHIPHLTISCVLTILTDKKRDQNKAKHLCQRSQKARMYTCSNLFWVAIYQHLYLLCNCHKRWISRSLGAHWARRLFCDRGGGGGIAYSRSWIAWLHKFAWHWHNNALNLKAASKRRQTH